MYLSFGKRCTRYSALTKGPPTLSESESHRGTNTESKQYCSHSDLNGTGEKTLSSDVTNISAVSHTLCQCE